MEGAQYTADSNVVGAPTSEDRQVGRRDHAEVRVTKQDGYRLNTVGESGELGRGGQWGGVSEDSPPPGRVTLKLDIKG